MKGRKVVQVSIKPYVMKKILLSVVIVLTFPAGYAQPTDLGDPDWYIDYIVLDGITHESPINVMGGPIVPNIVFEETIAYAIVDPESDSFFSDITYDVNDPEFTFINPAITLPGCKQYCDFASKYFQLLFGDGENVLFAYEILITDSGELYLTITDEVGNYAFYQDTPIFGVNDLVQSKSIVYPNPVSDVLFISSEKITIEYLSVFSISGKLVLEQRNIDNSIDVSELPQGMYFLKLTSEYGKAVQKFIKE